MTFTTNIIIERLEWDSVNTIHILKHGVIKEEVEIACDHIVSISETRNNRLLVTGLIGNDRHVTVILAPKGNGVYYPVTARYASRKERQLAKQGGEDQ